MTEAEIQHAIRLTCGRGATALWRNETGVSEHGWKQAVGRAIAALRRGNIQAALIALTKPKLSRVRYGLCKGSADLIGLTEVTIRPEHVGQTLGVFTAIEVKTDTGRVSPEQVQFLDLVTRRHGIAFVARDADEAAEILRART